VLHKPLLLILVLVAGVGMALAEGDGDVTEGTERGVGLFVFKVPRGWQDKSTELITVAVDDKHKLVFQAKVVKGGAAADEALLDKYLFDAERSLKKLMPEAKLEVKTRQLVKIAGLPSARFLFDMITGEGREPVRTLQFYVPAPKIDQHAILTFSGPPNEFDQQIKLLDQVARATVVKSK
jgi:hypothetical protein